MLSKRPWPGVLVPAVAYTTAARSRRDKKHVAYFSGPHWIGCEGVLVASILVALADHGVNRLLDEFLAETVLWVIFAVHVAPVALP